MAEPTAPPTSTLDALQAIASTDLAQFGQDLRGAPQGALDAYRAVASTTTRLRSTATSMTAAIAAMEAEATDLANRGGAEASRVKRAEATAKRGELGAQLEELSAEAHTYADVAEQALRAALIPKVASDAGVRNLAQREIDSALAGTSEQTIADALRALVGSDPTLDAEVLTGYGERQLRRRVPDERTANQLWSAVVAEATQKLAGNARTDTARAAGQALLKIGKLKGSIDAYRESARLKIREGM
jgi:hypothetical protein